MNYVLGWQQQRLGGGSGARMTAGEAVAILQTLGGIVAEEEEGGMAAAPSPLLLACLHLRSEVQGMVAAADEGALD